MNVKTVIELYSKNNIAEANKLLELILLEKIEIALENKKQMIFSEGDIKVNNKKKKNVLAVRAGRTINGISAKHSGRTLFRTLQPSQLKSILATEQFKPVGYHSKYATGLKKHLRISHAIQRQRKNRLLYKNLQNRLDRK